MLRLCVRVMYILCFYLVLIVDNASKKCSKQNTSGNFAYNLVTNQAFSYKTYNFGRGEVPFQVPWVSVGLKMTRPQFMFIQDFKCRIYRIFIGDIALSLRYKVSSLTTCYSCNFVMPYIFFN